MIGSAVIIVFIIFFFFCLIILFSSHIMGYNSHSQICVCKYSKPWTGIAIPTHSRVCLEVNTHTGTLDYFMNDMHIKDRVVNVPKDVYFGV
jgi:hypothetical protein